MSSIGLIQHYAAQLTWCTMAVRPHPAHSVVFPGLSRLWPFSTHNKFRWKQPVRVRVYCLQGTECAPGCRDGRRSFDGIEFTVKTAFSRPDPWTGSRCTTGTCTTTTIRRTRTCTTWPASTWAGCTTATSTCPTTTGGTTTAAAATTGTGRRRCARRPTERRRTGGRPDFRFPPLPTSKPFYGPPFPLVTSYPVFLT